MNILKDFRDRHVLVIGEAVLDVYYKGEATRICREGPVPIVRVASVRAAAGCAANTAVNAATLGARTTFLSVIGQDSDADILVDLLNKKNVVTDYIVRDQHRATPSKKRVVASSQLVVRYDHDDLQGLTENAKKALLVSVENLFPTMDAVIISDYEYGVMFPELIETLKRLQSVYHKIVAVDAKKLTKYKALMPTAVKPNFQEAVEIIGNSYGSSLDRGAYVAAHKKKLLEQTGARLVAVTLDEDGSMVFGKEDEMVRMKAAPVENPHVSGAGDTYLSAFTLSLASGYSLEKSAALAQTAAGIAVSKEGTAHITVEEVAAGLNVRPKLLSGLRSLKQCTQQLRRLGKRIVFTNGCFDILHIGHVSYLAQAKAMGDILVVGVNSDTSVRKLKGPTRPVNSEEDRTGVLAGLESVDFVVTFAEKTPRRLIEEIKPDVYVKGGDYTRETLPETPDVEKYGGTVAIVPFVVDRSTTRIIERISVKNGINKKALVS